MVRPAILFPLFADVGTLQGVGPKTKDAYIRLCGDKVLDVVYHSPVSVVLRKKDVAINQMRSGDVVTITVRVEKHSAPPKRSRAPYKVLCYNDTGFVTILFFNANSDYIQKQLPIGEIRVVSGKVDGFSGEKQIVHPDYIVAQDNEKSIPSFEPIYPLTYGLTNKFLLKTIHSSLDRLPPMPEWIDAELLKQQNWCSWNEAMKLLHNPVTINDLQLTAPFRRRLAYDEFLASQLALAIMRKQRKKTIGVAKEFAGELKDKVISSLPFDLTNAQKKAISEIEKEQCDAAKMMRLLQGDVGSGKTVVALAAMLNVVELGKQASLMAPTEILSIQHYEWIKKVAEPFGVKVALLTGRLKAKEKREALEAIKNGDVDIVVGTHALFQDKVEFKDLALAIIDEQHRFGVKQRMELSNKGKDVDVLLMTATPIPRTLTMTLYGDMECTIIDEKPANRKDIITLSMPENKRGDIIEGIKRVVDKGEKVYWICPLIEESEELDLVAVEERYDEFKRIFGDSVALMHGKMKGEEREKIMLEFKNGKTNILIATTVVEVGVDVPDATVMVIEHAERFGLSQLHQLRGRVGRGDKQSSCVLLYYKINEISKSRIKMMRETNDGFRLAEEDLRLRGGGEILGTRQSGLPEFKVANLTEHYDLLKIAGDDAKLILNKDPQLQTQRGNALRSLLYLFEYDSYIKYINAG